MIDFIRLDLPPGTLDDCPVLTLPSVIDLGTGEECSPWRETEYEGLKVRVHSNGRTILEGSLHQYWSKTHNGGEFPAWAVNLAIQQLSEKLDFDPEQARILSMEFGVNIPLQSSAKDLLQRAVLHKTDPLDLKTFGSKGYFREATKQQYYFKLYDKALQLIDLGFPDPGPLLRVELKVRKLEYLKEAGVNTLADLTKPSALLVMGQLLTHNLEQVLFAAPLPLAPTLNKLEKRLLRDGSSQRYWAALKPSSRTTIKHHYRKIYATHVADPALSSAIKGLQNTWLQLTEAQPQSTIAEPALIEVTIAQINPLFRVLPASAPTPVEGAGELVKQAREEGDGEEEEKSKQCTRFCKTCGKPINTGNAAAKFCSAKERGAAEAKQCRNADSNLRNNKRRSLRRIESLPLLFDTRPFVHVPEQVRDFVLT
jgi:hypothetical protein